MDKLNRLLELVTRPWAQVDGERETFVGEAIETMRAARVFFSSSIAATFAISLVVRGLSLLAGSFALRARGSHREADHMELAAWEALATWGEATPLERAQARAAVIAAAATVRRYDAPPPEASRRPPSSAMRELISCRACGAAWHPSSPFVTSSDGAMVCPVCGAKVGPSSSPPVDASSASSSPPVDGQAVDASSASSSPPVDGQAVDASEPPTLAAELTP